MRIPPGLALFLAGGMLLLRASPAAARILTTRSTNDTYQEHDVVVGSGVEVNADSGALPFLIEWSPYEWMKLSLEPAFVATQTSSGAWSSGLADADASIILEGITERRWRPSVGLELDAKIPLSRNREISRGKPDFTLGLVVSKEIIWFDVEAGLNYPFVGRTRGQRDPDVLQGSLAAEWHVSRIVDIEGEFVASSGVVHDTGAGFGGFRRGTSQSQGGSSLEGTVGIAEHLSRHLKLEQGFTDGVDGSWQVVAAWEYDFGRDR